LGEAKADLSLQETLKRLAPRTPAHKRDRFVPFLEEACKRYEIDTELRLAAFLATICYESAHFQATKEGLARVGTKARRFQDKYWDTGFYGRGLIQLTHEDNYRAFQTALDALAITHQTGVQIPNFISNPNLVAEPKWAVESACWYWKKHKFNSYADRGEFYEIQDLVNTGRLKDGKEPLHYEEREKLYKIALKAVKGNNISPPDTAPPTKPSEAPVPEIHLPAEAQKDGGETFFNKTTTWISDKRTKLSQIGVDADPMKISTSSKTVTVLGYLKFAILAAISYLYENPLYLVLGIALLIAIVWFISKAKDRKNERTSSTPQNQQTNINVEAK
jgi:putative chitinase